MRRKESSLVFNTNGIILSVIVVAVLSMLVLYMPALKEFDVSVLDFVRNSLSQYPVYIPLFISEFGLMNHLLWPLVAAFCVLISHKKYLQAFMLILFTESSYFIKDLIKNYVCRERPEACASGFSFPSGHCTVEMCFLGILIYLINRYVSNKFWRYGLITLFSVWLVLLAISRMWLGAHFLTDVIAGLFLGFGLVQIYIILDKVISR